MYQNLPLLQQFLLLPGGQDVVAQVQGMALGKCLWTGDEVRQFLVRQQNGDLGVLCKVDAVLQLHQLPDVAQKLVGVLVVELFADGHIVDTVVFQAGRVAFPLNHPLDPLIGYIPANVVLVVGAKDELPAAVGMGGIVSQNRVTGSAAPSEEVQNNTVRVRGNLQNPINEGNRFWGIKWGMPIKYT